MSLDLWNSVQTTDPKYTKSFSRAGGFSGTAINATYQIKRATEKWGPLGGKWGYKVLDSDFVQGHQGTVVHVLRIEFRHPEGTFEAFGQTTFCGTNKNGPYTDEEAPKKSLTDALTKALAMLGFSADVHLGMYDDNKYVNDLKNAKPANTAQAVMVDSFDALPKEIQELMSAKANTVRDYLDSGNVTAAYDRYAEFRDALDDTSHKAAFRSLFSASEKSALKKEGESRK